jgi:hypothetical protein
MTLLRSKQARLPIEGVGVFESVFLGDRLRIGQNINGGGALAVQVRVQGDLQLLP